MQDVIRQVATYGFYHEHLPLRQDSPRHSQDVADILAHRGPKIDYLAFDEQARLAQLSELIAQNVPLLVEMSSLAPATRETLQVFEVMARMRDEVRADAFGNYVISMTHSAS